MATAGIVILCLLLLFFAFISLGTGAVYVQEARKQRPTWKTAPGSVKHSEFHLRKGSATPYFPTMDQKTYTNTVEFTSHGGQTFTVMLGDKVLPVNRPITVHYDPVDPEHTATLASPAGKRASGYVLQVLSLLLLLAVGGIVYSYFFA